MGCDIHTYKEKFVNGKWRTADEWVDEYGDGPDVPFKKRFTERNYNLFGTLSKGVRGEQPFSFEPRGMPLQPCPEIAAGYESFGSDGHSHSYLYLHELKELKTFLEAQTIKVSGMKDPEGLAALEASIKSGSPDWNLLYPYCGWTTMTTAREFQFDVPASFMLGESIGKLIALFDGIEGENHRLVFWFDN